MSLTRRTFLKDASTLLAAGLVTANMTPRMLWAAQPVDLLPVPDEALLRQLALIAIDAARAAGASFADVRVSSARTVSLVFENNLSSGTRDMTPPNLLSGASYGVRAMVDGAWGFAAGSDLVSDDVAATARMAVAEARSNRPRHPRTVVLAPAALVSEGRWVTPIKTDPFTIPLSEQADLALAAMEKVGAAGIDRVQLALQWVRSNRVFASTEGSLISQQLDVAVPQGGVTAFGTPGVRSTTAGASARIDAGGYGYEAISDVDVGALLVDAAQRARALAKDMVAHPPTSVDVGRYDLVISRRAVATLVRDNVSAALNLERALGYHANRGGTTFAAPPAQTLGQFQVGSKLLTVTADRSMSHSAATVGWDDEGIKPEAYTLVKDGVIVDYHTNRQMATQLGSWYQQRGEAIRSHGCASGSGGVLPNIAAPNLRIAPGGGSADVTDLIADTKHGFYIESIGNGGVDQQFLNAQYNAGPSAVREIVDGKLGGYVANFAFQFTTPEFWKKLDALGGPQSAGVETFFGPGIAPDRLTLFPSIDSVPGRIREVNVVNTGRRA
jgi:TldD protein